MTQYENHKLNGKHSIAGEWVGSDQTFTSDPATGHANEFAVGTPELVDRAVQAAERAFDAYSMTSRAVRADFLDRVANEIDARGDAITAIGTSETGLPTARLEGERGRTTDQLRLFADHIREGSYLDRRHDAALPDRKPAPRPDLHMIQRPIGPVAVFGASNFPLAFSTAGGDTAAALAAGCPVVVKGHSAHPGTSEVVADAICAAVDACDMPRGVFSLIQGDRRDVGHALVQHPLIRAVGFTGSLSGGRALFDLCASRSEPIPFFGELGSINPMFVLPYALTSRAAEIGSGWAGSLCMGAGQFCTNPGVVFVVDGHSTNVFVRSVEKALNASSSQMMLTHGIAEAYRSGRDHLGLLSGVSTIVAGSDSGRNGAAALFETDGQAWLSTPALSEEVFGPLGLVVRVADIDEMVAIAQKLHGQLTTTLHLDDDDTEVARKLMPILERKSGRVLANGFPTGVEVNDSMVHGGPYPASTNFGATSVGTLSIRRFLRPKCFQNIPERLLPLDLVSA